MKEHVLVIGAGIFGATAALELSQRGYRVTILAPGPIPDPRASSTDISKLIRMEYGADALYTAWMEEALEGWRAWQRAWGAAASRYHEEGLLVLCREPPGPGSFERESFEMLIQRGHPMEWLDPATIRRRFPQWSESEAFHGYFNPAAGWARSASVVRWLHEEALRSGVRYVDGRALALCERGGRVVGAQLDDAQLLEADHTVLAAGVWSPQLWPALESVIEVVGQPIFHFAPRDPEAWRPPAFHCWTADISSTGWYGFSANAEGVVKVANHGPGVRLTPDAPRALEATREAWARDFLWETFPMLSEAPCVGQRWCLYSDSWDGNFYICPAPDCAGLTIATGGSGHGFKFAPVLGGLIADVLEGRPSARAERFAWRSRAGREKEDARFLR